MNIERPAIRTNLLLAFLLPYGALGLDGLGHYTLAPLSAQTVRDEHVHMA